MVRSQHHSKYHWYRHKMAGAHQAPQEQGLPELELCHRGSQAQSTGVGSLITMICPECADEPGRCGLPHSYCGVIIRRDRFLVRSNTLNLKLRWSPQYTGVLMFMIITCELNTKVTLPLMVHTNVLSGGNLSLKFMEWKVLWERHWIPLLSIYSDVL